MSENQYEIDAVLVRAAIRAEIDEQRRVLRREQAKFDRLCSELRDWERDRSLRSSGGQSAPLVGE